MEFEEIRQRIDDMLITMFVAPKAKVAYVPVTKAGSTSMLRILAEMEGHDTTRYLAQPEMIHHHDTYPLPKLTSLPDDLQREVLTSDEWIRLTVTRDPFKRFYSAWEDKIFIGRPGWDHFSPPPFVEFKGGIDIGASFRRFVADFDQRRELWMSDPHFVTQVTLSRPSIIPYTDTISTSEYPNFIERLSERSGVHLHNHRSNEGLNLPSERFWDDESVAIILDAYAEDFVYTGSPAQRPTKKTARIALDPLGTRLHALTAERHRIAADTSWDLRVRYGEMPAEPRERG